MNRKTPIATQTPSNRPQRGWLFLAPRLWLKLELPWSRDSDHRSRPSRGVSWRLLRFRRASPALTTRGRFSSPGEHNTTRPDGTGTRAAGRRGVWSSPREIPRAAKAPKVSKQKAAAPRMGSACIGRRGATGLPKSHQRDAVDAPNCAAPLLGGNRGTECYTADGQCRPGHRRVAATRA